MFATEAGRRSWQRTLRKAFAGACAKARRGVGRRAFWLSIVNHYLCLMAQEQMSVIEYAILRGISRQAVDKQIANNRDLPGVAKYSKVGRSYVLTVDRKKIPKKV